MLKETGRFTCADEDGNRYTVVEYRTVVTITNLDGKRHDKLGAFDYKLATGEHVNYLSETEFEIVMSGKKVTRD